MKKILLCCFFVSFLATHSWGNGVVLSNLSSVSGIGFVQLKFDITWSNSWMNNINHDAAWVFFKFKDKDGSWGHIKLTGANNVIAAGFSADVPSDNSGVMIHRNAAGIGTVTLTNVSVGVANLPGTFDVRGFALEMVNIPLTDTFFVGDGVQSPAGFQNGTTSMPFLVAANTITMGTATGNLNADYASYSMTNGTFASAYPTGYSTRAGANMYMMKHEISQAAYRDFLNTLDYTQQNNRTGVAPNSSSGTQAITGSFLSQRQSIQIATSGTSSTVPAIYGCNLNNNTTFNEATDGEWIGQGNLNWQDLAAFLDWAALRPMTELEYEKSCRGPVLPVRRELASGTNLQAINTYSTSNVGAANESATYTESVLKTNVTWDFTSNYPLRVGIHATANSTRISAGAGYYGALDLSGNISELVVSATNVAGRSYTGKNGDGTLTYNGDANEDYWPGINGNISTTVANAAYIGGGGVSGYAGWTSRGGSRSTGSSSIAGSYYVSSLYTATSIPTRFREQGGRGVKSW